MRKNKIAYKIIISLLSLLLLVYSTVLQFSLPAVVLCFGDDGHIAFEQSELENPCVDTTEHGDYLIGSHENLSHQDEDCNDIPLINLYSIPFIEKESKSKTLKLSIVENYSKFTNTSFISQFNIVQKSTTNHPILECLQSTILLI
jgi:hypothetical protein